MNWRVRLAVWLLRSFAVDCKMEYAEVLVFVDPTVIDLTALEEGVWGSEKSSVPVTFIPVRPRPGQPISNSLIGVAVPKKT